MPIVSTGQLTLTDLNDTKQVILYLNANYKTQVYDQLTTSYSPNFTSTNLTITPELYVAGGGGSNLLPSADVQSITWYEGSQTTTAINPSATNATTTAGYTYTLPTGAVSTTARVLTIKSNLTSSQKYTCVLVYRDPDTGFDITIKSDVEILRVMNGAKGDVGVNAVTAFLTNSHTSLSTTNAGVVTYTNSGTDIYVYDGTTALVYDGVGTSNGKFKVIATATGITAGAISASASGTTRALVANSSAITGNTASISFAVTGKTLTGADISATLLQTFNKSINGNDGTTPSSYWVTLSSDVISKNPVGNIFTPSTITATSNVQTGTATPVRTTSMKWLVGTSTDGTTFTDGSVQTGATVTNTAIANGSTIKAIRFRMYLSTTTTPDGTNFVDEQIVPVITEGMDAYYLNTWTPNGDTIRNGVGSLTIQSDLFKGGATATPSAYKWYVQDSTATTASGGDTDGGNGWRLIGGLSDATTAPTLSLQANANTRLTAQTYYVKYTWLGLSGETIGSTESSIAVTAGNDLKVVIPAFATNAFGAKVYVGTATGNANLKYQGLITTSAGNIVISSFDSSGSLIPTVSTATSAIVTSSTITIVPQAIAGVEGYKCVATAPTTGNKYSGLAVVKDMQDPIVVNVLGASVLKNGQGSTVLTAQLIQNGVEIPTAGYTFSWALYNQNGTLNKAISGSGDTVTVLASDFNGINNIVVDVSK